MPTQRCSRIWVSAANAANAEVWSTALMLVEPDELASFIESKNEIQSLIIDRSGRVEKIR
jgi:thiamine biosynthesis lipoprotein ApbE